MASHILAISLPGNDSPICSKICNKGSEQSLDPDKSLICLKINSQTCSNVSESPSNSYATETM